MADFPAECEHVIDTLAVIYKHDQEAKDRNLTALQQHSSDIFQNPENWLPWNFENAVERKNQQIVDNPRIIG
jgi:hypothetical protein